MALRSSDTSTSAPTTSRALALLDCGHLADAESICDRILSTNPKHAPAIHILGLTAQAAGRDCLAIERFRRAIELQPTIPDYHNDLGSALANLRRFDESAAAYRQAIRLRPAYPEAHANLGHILAELDQPGSAESAYRRAIQLQPAFAPFHADLANLLRRTGRLDRRDFPQPLWDGTQSRDSHSVIESFVIP